jgi:nucleoside-diphosphate-sugar epimerase
VRRPSSGFSRLGPDLGWAPSVRLEDGLREQWSWASARVAAG